MALYVPDRYFSRVSNIDVARDLIGAGYTSVLLDVDNTLLTRDEHHVPVDVRAWLGKVTRSGVNVCLLSNNFHQNVVDLAQNLGLPIVSKAMKPLPHGYLLACRKIGARRKQTVMVGDQLTTDILGAQMLGMGAYLVCPLVEADLRHTLVLRNVENLFIGDREPEGAATASCETSHS